MTAAEFKTWAAARNMQLTESKGQFKVGDVVTYTNEFGVSFPGKEIIGISTDESLPDRFFHLDKTAYWFPVKESELSK